MATDWEGLAKQLDFNSPREMLDYWYSQQGKSIKQIAVILEITYATVRRELIIEGVEKIREKVFVCRHCNKKHNGDSRRTCCDDPDCYAKEQKFLEELKRLRKEVKLRQRDGKRSINSCKICGGDKGENRYYCKNCHASLSVGMLFD